MDIIYLLIEYIAIALGVILLALMPLAALGGLMMLIAYVKDLWENS